MREPHFIWQAKGDSLPSRLVGIDCDAEEHACDAEPKVRREALARWCAAGWQDGRDGSHRLWEGEGTTEESAWEAVDWGLRRGGQTWVVSLGAARVWGLLGLWGRIERGEVVITGADARASGASVAADQVPQVPQAGVDCGHVAGRDADSGVHRMRRVRSDGRAGIRDAKAVRSTGTGYCVLEDPPNVVFGRIHNRPGTLLIVDLRNYGIDTFPDGLDLAQRARWIRDVMARMCGILRDGQLGALKVTAGAQALHVLKRRYLTHSIYCHDNAEALALEQAAYVGGRCECRRLGKVKGPVYHLDFRNLYPAVCSSWALPALLSSIGGAHELWQPGACDGALQSIASVSLQTDEPAYCYRRGSDVVYPVGRFSCVLAGPELADAAERGRIVKVHQVATYHMAPCLKAYADGLYAILEQARQENDAPICAWLKRLLVSIVGKFGQRDWKWEGAPDACPPGPWETWWGGAVEGELTRYRSLGWQCQREVKGGWGYDASPAIAAWVCSAGRVRLLDAIRCAGWENVLYYDTDSLFVRGEGYSRLQDDGRVSRDVLGHLRLIGTYGYVAFHGIKHYEVDGKLVCAGLPKGTTARGPDDKHYWYRDWLRRACSSGHAPEVRRVLVRYARAATYRHGRVGDNGEVLPFEVHE